MQKAKQRPLKRGLPPPKARVPRSLAFASPVHPVPLVPLVKSLLASHPKLISLSPTSASLSLTRSSAPSSPRLVSLLTLLALFVAAGVSPGRARVSVLSTLAVRRSRRRLSRLSMARSSAAAPSLSRSPSTAPSPTRRARARLRVPPRPKTPPPRLPLLLPPLPPPPRPPLLRLLPLPHKATHLPHPPPLLVISPAHLPTPRLRSVKYVSLLRQ